jgi:DNA-binding NtrC family response regulator
MRCADIPDARLESELYAHAARAHGGSLLLEEVDGMSLRVQEGLLRFHQSRALPSPDGAPRAVDARLIATTIRPLYERVAARTFLEDLYYGLNTIYIRIPPLRDDRHDIPFLIDQMLQALSTRHRITPPRIGPSAMALLQAYDWPGNTRELRDVLESLLISGRRRVIDADDLPATIAAQSRKKTAAAYRPTPV